MDMIGYFAKMIRLEREAQTTKQSQQGEDGTPLLSPLEMEESESIHEQAEKGNEDDQQYQASENEIEKEILEDSELEEFFVSLSIDLQEWITASQDLEVELLALKAEMIRHHTNVHYAKISGHSAAAVGGMLTLAGLAAAFFTFGTSLTLSAAGNLSLSLSLFLPHSLSHLFSLYLVSSSLPLSLSFSRSLYGPPSPLLSTQPQHLSPICP